MPITTIFRTILVASILSGILTAVAGIMLANTMPVVLQEYLINVDDKELTNNITILLLFSITFLILLFVSLIGLWKFKNWARVIYLMLIIVTIPSYFIFGPLVMNTWEAMFNDITLILDGTLISMMYFSPINEKFKI